MYFVESWATTRKTLLYISKYTLHNLYSISNACCIFASLVINILQLYKTITVSRSPEKNNKFLHPASYGAQGKNILPDTDMENGGFRDLLGIEKVRKC